MSTVIEQIQRAALSLASSGPLKDRLIAAYRDHLASIESADLPRDLAEDLIFVRRALVRERPLSRGEDAVHATVRKMSNEEAGDLAARVVMLYGALCSYSPQQSMKLTPHVNGSASSVVHLNRA
jgi:hypothetical protein